MAITLIGRETPRKQLGVILKADIDAAMGVDCLVCDHEPKETGGRSPVVTIHSDGSKLKFAPYAMETHRYYLNWYWLRDDPALTEDRFDRLSLVIMQSLVDHVSEAGYWNDLLFAEDFSAAAYILLEGKQYRTERMSVSIESICDNL